jgi:AmiR/NasT family two-component response regulator
MATACVANASRLDRLRHTAEQLQTALDSRIVIEQAKGLVAGERGITLDEAFEVLRGHARSRNASLRSVSEAVVTLGLRP